jgi:hypothetical protein
VKRSKREALKREQTELRRRLRAEREQLAAEVERASLNHFDGSSFDADQRVGARLLRADGSVLVERIDPPNGRLARWHSLHPLSVAGLGSVPPSAR